MSPISTNDGPLCEVCKVGIGYISTSMKGMEAEIKTLILGRCAMLPAPMKAEVKFCL